MEMFFVLLFICLFAIIALFVWYFFLGETGELKKLKKEFEIFGLNEGFVPQGIAYVKKHKKFLISGYMSKKNSPSRIYVIDEDSGECDKFVTLKFDNGKDYFGKASGIVCRGGNCWVSSDGQVYRFFVDDLIASKVGQAVVFYDCFETKNNADFCFLVDDFLWVGEFYKLGKSQTDLTHHISCGGEIQSHALALAFKLSDSEKSVCGVESKVPHRALAIPDMVRGIVQANGKFYLSCSYGLSKSMLLEYENVFIKKSQMNYGFGTKSVPLWAFSDKFLKNSHVYPEMLEQIVFVNGRIYMLFKSAARKYRWFARTSLNYVFSKK